MANPSLLEKPPDGIQSKRLKYLRTLEPRDYSYTYMRKITHSLLSLLEDFKQAVNEKSLFEGDLEALRRSSEEEMESIAL